MLSKRSPPLIGKLTGSSLSNPSGSGGATSPRSPLELKIQSPRGLKSYNLDGVGLGIVAALEKAGNFRSEIQSNKAFFNNRNSNRSKPIPVNSANNYPRPQKSSKEMDMEMEMEIEMDDSEEDYTFVTYHRPENKSYTRVYCNGDEQTQININKTVFNRNMKSKSKTKSNHGIVYEISPARFNEYSAFPTSDFLSSCDLCHKNLHGKDIYMYRGEKAFCSTECRYRQIVMDERKEKCGSEASRSSVDVSTSPYSDQIFSTGILAI